MTAQSMVAVQAPTQLSTNIAKTAGQTRLLYLDNLRLLLTILVVVHHLSIGYGSGGSWYYYEGGPLNIVSAILMWLFACTNQAFFMGFLFLISNYFSPRSYDHKGIGPFLTDRFKRLGIPLLLFVLTVQPLMIYMARLANGERQPVVQFWLDGFAQGGFGPGPLWFVEALLVFSVVYALWRRLAPVPARSEAAESPAPSNRATLAFALTLGLVTFFVRMWMPMGRQTLQPFGFDLGIQPAYFPQYIALFIAGLFAYRHHWFEKITESQVRPWRWAIPALAALLPVAALAAGALEGNERGNGGFYWEAPVFALWEQVIGTAIILNLLVWFREKFTGQSPLTREMSDAAYAAYIVHPLVIVPLAAAFAGIRVDMSLKFVLVAPLAVALTFVAGWVLKKLPFARIIL